MWVTQLASENANNYFKRKPLLRTARQNALIGSGYRSRIKKNCRTNPKQAGKASKSFPVFCCAREQADGVVEILARTHCEFKMMLVTKSEL